MYTQIVNTNTSHAASVSDHITDHEVWLWALVSKQIVQVRCTLALAHFQRGSPVIVSGPFGLPLKTGLGW
jgi:hypothetical protein